MRHVFHRHGFRIRSLTLALLLVVGASFASLPSFAKDPPPPKDGKVLSKNVVPPLKAAGDAFNAKQYDVADAKLKEADAVDKKTPYDQFRIDELRALLFLVQGQQGTNYEDAFAIYEKHLSAPEFLEPQQQENRLKVMTQLAFQTKKFPKVIEYGKEWIGTHPTDTTIIDLIARAYYIADDFKGALEYVKNASQVNEAAGKPPEEIWLQLESSCAAKLDNQAEVVAGYEKLVRYYPKGENWTKVTEAALHSEKNDLAIFYLLRLMADTNVLSQSDYYYEYAQRASEQALPGEAADVLEKGFDKKAIGQSGADKDRYQRALTEAKRKAQADRGQLPALEKEWKDSKASTGQIGAGLGLAYFEFQMYDKAIESLEAAIAKGGLKNGDNYRMTLGVAYWKAGQKEKSRAQFQAIPSESPLARAAGFWTARSYN